MSWLPLFTPANAINHLLYGHENILPYFFFLKASSWASHIHCCMFLPAVHRVHNNVPVRVCGVHGGRLYASHLISSAWHAGCVRNYCALCCRRRIWLMLLLMKQMTPAGSSAAVWGEFTHLCVHTEYICSSLIAQRGFYLFPCLCYFIPPLRLSSLLFCCL